MATMNDGAESLRLAPEADVVVQIQQVKERSDILTFMSGELNSVS